MKKNIFKTFFGFTIGLIRDAIFFLFYIIAFPFAFIFIKGKTRGKENLKKDDEARVFVANHYEVYGPFIAYLHFPYNFRPWIIDKMIDPKTVESHMSIGIYNQFPKFPKWLKTVFIKVSKSLMVFFMKTIARGIPVSREDFRKNIKTMQISTETLENGEPLLIFPEQNAVKEGVGEFMTGFEHIGKYYYQKTGKKISFYPMFISKENKTMYIGEPVIYNPDNDANEEKARIVESLKDRMVNDYIKYECGKPHKNAKKLSRKRRK
jgi:hypothetical protein